MKKITILILFIAIAFSGCNNKNSFTKVSLRQEWFANANFAGELFAVNETAKNYGLEIKLEAGSDNVDPIKLVLSGENEFGVVSSDRILTANEKGADLVVIGVANYISPTCFLAKKSLNINSPKDFENHKVGILTGTNTELVYKSLIRIQNVDEKKIKEIEAPFDLATFIAGQYDVRPAFIYDEPVSLDKQNIAYTLINPINFGVEYIGTVYFCPRKLIESKPEVVQAFVNSIADGWKLAFKNPDKAIEYLKKYDNNIDKQRELQSLKKCIDYFKGEDGKVLYSSIGRWEKMKKYLIDIGVVSTVDLTKIVNNNFVLKYHSDKGKL